MKDRTTIWSRNFTILFLTNSILFFGQSMASTLLPKYLNSLGLTSTLIGFIVSLFSFTALGLRPVTGPLIDGWNKKRLYLIMLACLVVGFFGYGMSDSVFMLGVCRLIHGLGMGCISALALAMATDALPKEKMASGLSIYGLSSVLSQSVGPGLGVMLMERYGYRVAFFTATALLIIAFVLGLGLEKEDRVYDRIRITLSGMIYLPSLLPAILLMLSSIARAGLTTFLVVFITDVRHIEGISVYYLVNAVALILARLIAGKIADRSGLHIALIPSYILFAATLILTAFCRSTLHLMILAVVNAFGYGSAFTSQQAICMKMADAGHRGSASTTAYIGIDIGDLVGPVLCGAIAERAGYPAMFCLSVIPLILSAALLYTWVPRHRAALVPGYSETPQEQE